MAIVEMNSAIFRRRTYKSYGRRHGGAMTELQQQEKNLAGLNKQLLNPGLTYRVRAELQSRRNAKKARVNALKATVKNAGILNTLTAKVGNAVSAVTSNAKQTENAMKKTNNAMQQPGEVNQAIVAANTAVIAANAAVDKSKNLAKLANNANALARGLRSMLGGKRNRRTRRK